MVLGKKNHQCEEGKDNYHDKKERNWRRKENNTKTGNRKRRT
jgi:hypothetical protein